MQKEKSYKQKHVKPREKGGHEFEYWDKRQLVKKINPNSLYGAPLNPGSDLMNVQTKYNTYW